MATDITVIIPAFNSKFILEKTMPALFLAIPQPDEILVVDTGSSDGTLGWLKENFKDTVKTIRLENNLGFAPAVNFAVEFVRTKFFYLLNPDVFVEKDFLAPFEKYFNDEKIFAVSSLDTNSFSVPYLSSQYIYRHKYTKVFQFSKAQIIPFATGGHSLYHKEKFIQLGKFREVYAPVYWEDIDIGWRAYIKGYKLLLDAESRVFHRHHATIDSLNKKDYFRKVYWEHYFFFHHLNFSKKYQVNFFGSNILTGIKSIFRKDRNFFGGLLSFLKTRKQVKTNVPGKNEGKLLSYLKYNSPPRILFLEQEKDFLGGGQRSLALLLKTLSDCSIVVACPSGGEFAEEIKNYAEIVDVKFPQIRLRNVFLIISDIVKLIKTIYEKDINIIQANSVRCAFWAGLISKFTGRKSIYQRRIIARGYLDLPAYVLNNRIIAISNAVAEKIWFKKKVQVIYNAVDQEKFSPDRDVKKLKTELKIPDGRRIISIISRLDWWKGHKIFLYAVKKVITDFPDLVVLIAGDGPEKENLKNLVKQLALDGQVIFTGYRNEIPEIINLSEVVVSAAIVPEPFGRVIIETMACGKVIVATDMGAAAEIIEHLKDGILTEATAAAIAYWLKIILSDKKLQEEIGKNARRKVLEKFTAKEQAKKVYQIYQELL